MFLSKNIFFQVGEIWPQNSIDIVVIYQAIEMGEISSVAYLEVTGREDRIPVRLPRKLV